MDTLVLNSTPYRLPLAETYPDAYLSAYEQRVLQFARQWLSGQETFIVQTSGSTGQPKAITIHRSQMVASAHLTGKALGLQPGDRALVCVSVDYIAGMMMLVRSFELDLPLTIIDPVNRPLAPFPATVRFEFTAMVPLQLQATLDGAAHELTILDHMKGVLIGGAPVSRALEDRLQQVTAPLYSTYGMTETVSHIALRRLNGSQRSEYFVPFESVALGQDARGCLTITSILTRDKTFTTNDLVTLSAEGSFQWLGRVDNVINSGGVKVQIEKVEIALETWLARYQNGMYGERRFFVGALPHPGLGQTVVAVVEGTPFGGGATLSPAMHMTLRTALQQSLTPYEMPRQWHFIPQLLTTPTGKIDRRANLQRLAPTLEAQEQPLSDPAAES